jgi:hypothetical protein
MHGSERGSDDQRTRLAIPFLEYWENMVDELDAGNPVEFRPGDIPLFIDAE